MGRSLKIIVFIGFLSLLLAACGGNQPASKPNNQPDSAASESHVTIKGFAFDPAEVTVKVGTTVTWTNEDGATHTITSDDGSWDSGRVVQAGTFSQLFDQAGSFSYHCEIHASMKGTIIVTP